MLDQPGSGEALRLQGLPARIDTEAGAGALDWLRQREDVDASRIGIAVNPVRGRSLMTCPGRQPGPPVGMGSITLTTPGGRCAAVDDVPRGYADGAPHLPA